MGLKEEFDSLFHELDEERKNLISKLHVVKLEALEGWDKVEEYIEHLKEGKDDARVQMHLAKLEIQEKLDELTDKLNHNLSQLKSEKETATRQLNEVQEQTKSAVSAAKEKVQALVEELKEEKDEARVNLHLAKMEALEKLDDLDETVDSVMSHLDAEKDELVKKVETSKNAVLDGLENLTGKADGLKFDRDELRVRMHLAKLEMLEEWDKMDERFSSLRGNVSEVTDEVLDTAKNIGSDIREGLSKIRSKLS